MAFYTLDDAPPLPGRISILPFGFNILECLRCAARPLKRRHDSTTSFGLWTARSAPAARLSRALENILARSVVDARPRRRARGGAGGVQRATSAPAGLGLAPSTGGLASSSYLPRQTLATGRADFASPPATRATPPRADCGSSSPSSFKRRPRPILIAPFRGWRRALGTLVVEGAVSDELTNRAAPRPRGRSRAPAVGRHRERPAPRGDAAAAASARGHVQLTRRSRRRHRSRVPGRSGERRVCDARRPRRAPSCSIGRCTSSWAAISRNGQPSATATWQSSARAPASTTRSAETSS